MILDKVDKPPLPDDPTPPDAPPAYDGLSPSALSQAKQSLSSGSDKHSSHPSFFSSLSSRPTSPPVASTSQLPSAPPAPPISSLRLRKPASPGKASQKSQADVRATVLGLVRDLVQKASAASSSAAAARGILASCATACDAHGIALARVLQERSVEGHTPAYWAVVNRRRGPRGPAEGDGNAREDEDILFALLAHAAPLASASVSDLRLACLVAADNALLQRLRASPVVNPLSGTNLMLLSGSHDAPAPDAGPPAEPSDRWKGRGAFMDVVDVREGGENGNADAGVFSVRLELEMFQRRMRVSNEVAVEFVARGRLWTLCFFVVPPLSSPSTLSSSTSPFSHQSRPDRRRALSSLSHSRPRSAAAHARRYAPGAWAVCLALLEHSPPCFADARLVVTEPEPEPEPRAQAIGSVPPPLPPRPPNPSSSQPSIPGAFSLPPQTRNPFRVSALRMSFLDYVRPPQHPVQSLALPASASVSKPRTNARTKLKPKPPITLRLASPGAGAGALVAPPPPLDDLFPFDNSGPGTGKGRASRRERREREGRETRKERYERARLAETVVLASLEEQGQGQGRGGCLMYDGCSYIAPDGTLRAVLDARLHGAGARPEPDCVIC